MVMKFLLTVFCIFYKICEAFYGHLNVVLVEKNVSGRNLFQVCTPIGLNGDSVHAKKTNGSAINRKLVWLGAFVQYTPWMEYYGCGILRDRKDTVKKEFEADPSMFECNQKCSEIDHRYDFIGMQKNICYCLDKSQLNVTFASCKVKECDDLLCYNGASSKRVVLYHLNLRFTSTIKSRLIDQFEIYCGPFSGNDSQVGQCGVFNYNNTVSFGSRKCSDNSHPACYARRNSASVIKGHKTKSTWSESMKFCQESSPSSVENFGSAKYSSKQESATFHCVAALVSEDNTIQERVIEHCDKSLPVLCLESTTGAELTNSSHATITRPTTPNHIQNKDNEEHKSRIPWEIIAGFTGGIGIIVTIVLVIAKYRKRSPIRIEKSVEVTGLNHRSPDASNDETLEAENANIYDASKSEERCVMLKDSNYDSMSVIRQDTEGVYDHTSSTQTSHRKVEDVDVYDNADPVIIKQSLQIENDGVYNQCELNIKSVIAKAHMNGDSTTIYDHA
ncbi:unnamed protein product [Mytilus coruscus]|uniref:WSC domain-containing protein n=1 Tax=Mytilus coruscus TaxID=42192 RepID=A0A6J8AGA7_MYTCO|nr:unnamed protein product [Mytilus coruscus]